MKLELIRGDTASYAGVATLNGGAYNLTGASLRFTAKRSTTDADSAAVLSKTIGAGIVVTDAAAGKYRIDFAPGDTSGMIEPIAPLVFDVQLRTAAAEVYTLLTGYIWVVPDVSRTAP